MLVRHRRRPRATQASDCRVAGTGWSVSAGIMKSVSVSGTNVTVRVGTFKGGATAANHSCGIMRRNVIEVNLIMRRNVIEVNLLVSIHISIFLLRAGTMITNIEVTADVKLNVKAD